MYMALDPDELYFRCFHLYTVVEDRSYVCISLTGPPQPSTYFHAAYLFARSPPPRVAQR